MAANDRFYSQKIKTFFMRFDHDKNINIEEKFLIFISLSH